MTPMRTSHICTPHHFLPIVTCSDCPAQHPTCGCVALLGTNSVLFICDEPTTLAPEHLLLPSEIYVISSFMVQPTSTLPLRRRNIVLDFVIYVHFTKLHCATSAPKHVSRFRIHSTGRRQTRQGLTNSNQYHNHSFANHTWIGFCR
jgi:hypothetical protein